MAMLSHRQARFSAVLSERMEPISLNCVTRPEMCLPKSGPCRYGLDVPARDSDFALTRPHNGAPCGVFPPRSVDSPGSQRLRRIRLTAGSKDPRSANRARATRPSGRMFRS